MPCFSALLTLVGEDVSFHRKLAPKPVPNPVPDPVPIDTTPPVVAFLAPADGSTVSGNRVQVWIQAADDVSLARTEIYIDGVLVSNGTMYTWNTKSRNQKGWHTLTAKAYDLSGNMSETSIRVLAR